MKQQTIPTIILQQYPFLQGDIEFQSYGNGHINDTFLIKSGAGSFILQKVNNKIFQTDALFSNAEKFIPALEKFQHNNHVQLSPSFIKNINYYYHSFDDQGSVWRLVEFISGCTSHDISYDTGMSYRAAQHFGQFQSFLNTLDISMFDETIKNFHFPAARLKAFLDVLNDTPESLKNSAIAEIEFVLNHQFIASEMEALLRLNKIPWRITHNDPKLDNILFTPDNQLLVIDLDTVMPGTILYDFGDMVRTFTPGAAEDDPRPEKASLRINHFKALTQGYFETLHTTLTSTEKENMLMGAKAIIYEQTVRFLTDYLNGNTYYKINYPEHNLVRTRTQIKLLADVLEHETELNNIIHTTTIQL